MTEAWPTGTLIAEKFRVVRVLGTGGMGVVYEVIHEITRHRRALKTLNAKSREQPAAVERFLREASAAGRIGSPHITETFDAGVLGSGEPYLVMELLEGETLEARMQRKGRLEPEEILAIFGQAADGIQAAHDAGIIHRDLKPENVFLTKTKQGMRVKILDFGVSIFDERHRLDRSTQDGTILGTPYYMSPEQVRGERQLDGRSDVYALGIMIHECANGVHPYPADNVHAIIANVIEKQPKDLAELVAGFPPSLAALVGRAIEKDVERRVPSARALADGLASCAAEIGASAGFPPVSIATAASAQPKSAVSWISTPPPPVSVAVGPASAAGPVSAAAQARSVPPPPAMSGAVAVDVPSDVGPPPKRAPVVLSLVGGLLGAALVAAGLFLALRRTTPALQPDQARPPSSSTVAVSADPPAAPAPTPSGPDVVAAPASASAAPSGSAVAVPSPQASSLPQVAPPVAKPPHGPKAGDLAGKGEFKP